MANNFDLQIKSISGSQIEIQATDGVSLTGVEKVLVIQGGQAKEFTAQQIANLGGGSSYLVASVTLTDAQIKALPDLAVVIVAPPGANKWVNFVCGYIALQIDTFLYPGYGNVPVSGSANIAFIDQNNTNDLSIAFSNTLGRMAEFFSNGGYLPFIPIFFQGGVSLVGTTDVMENMGLDLLFNTASASGNLTGGDEHNKMLIKVWYTIEDIPI